MGRSESGKPSKKTVLALLSELSSHGARSRYSEERCKLDHEMDVIEGEIETEAEMRRAKDDYVLLEARSKHVDKAIGDLRRRAEMLRRKIMAKGLTEELLKEVEQLTEEFG